MQSQSLNTANFCNHNIEVVVKAYESKKPDEIIVIRLDNVYKYGIINMTYSNVDNKITFECYTQKQIDSIKNNKIDYTTIEPITFTYPYETSVEIDFGKIKDGDFIGEIERQKAANLAYEKRKEKERKIDKFQHARYESDRARDDEELLKKNYNVSLLNLLNFHNLNRVDRDTLIESVGKTVLAALFVAIFATMFSNKMKGGELTNPSNLSEKNLEQLISNLSSDQLIEIARFIEPKVDKTEVKNEISKISDKEVQTNIKTNINNYFPGFGLEEGETVFGQMFDDEKEKEGGKRRRTNKKRRTNKRRNNKKKSNRR
jgi:hypothetical protein